MVTGDLSGVLLAETVCVGGEGVCVCVCRCAFIRFLNSSICFVRFYVFVALINIVCTDVSV